MNSKKKARVIAYYLPQYHPIPENDKYWGKGFTEWVNVKKAIPLFKNHYQPKIPSDLGYYDLRDPEVRKKQAQLAKEAGIEGFCYWHYWFGEGKELLERPFNEVVDSGKPDFPFCLGWANHEWSTKTWTSSGQSKEIIAEMKYPGQVDYDLHFSRYLKAFKDNRYIKVDGKLLFVIFAPLDMPDFPQFKDRWNQLAIENDLKGFHFVGIVSNFDVRTKIGKKTAFNFDLNQDASTFYNRILKLGYDAVNSRGNTRAEIKSLGAFNYYFKKLLFRKFSWLGIVKVNYEQIIENYYVEEDKDENVYPTLIPNWDRTPRSKDTIVWYNTTPNLFANMIDKVLGIIKGKNDEHKIVFLQSWNEWGEGNYVEPDMRYGKGFLNILKELL